MAKRTKNQTTKILNGFAALILATLFCGSSPAEAVPNQATPRNFQTVVAPIQPEPAGALTFQSWKTLRVDEARLVLERLTLESQLERMPVVDRSPGEKQAVIRTAADATPRAMAQSRTTKLARADSRTEQARMNLEIAQDLTVNDYLVIYLSQFKSRDAILDVARRLTPEDIADLLMSYQKLSMGGQIAEHSMAPSPRTPPRPL